MDRTDWAERFEAQSRSCRDLGSGLYARLMSMLADDVRRGGSTWDLLADAAGTRFGDAVPLRLAAAAHRLALEGRAATWAAALPSCSGTTPGDDHVLWDAWRSMVEVHTDDLVDGLRRDVQTNEVGRSAGLAFALALSGPGECRLIEIGCSGALNLRLDRYRIELGDRVVGDPGSGLVLAPRMTGVAPESSVDDIGDEDPRPDGPGAARVGGPVPQLPRITRRIGIDPDPIDITTAAGRVRLESFVWPDQVERMARLRAAIEVAARTPVELIRSDVRRGPSDTAAVLGSVLTEGGPRVVMHSIVWQYVPKEVRWAVTTTLEEAGARATSDSPLVWIRYEPDEWNRTRAAIWMRSWPRGGDRLVAHADYHGRWLGPI